MKNYIHPSLKEVVPKEVRLEVYKKALEFYKGGKTSQYNLEEQKQYPSKMGICLLLPCVLWDLKNYCSNHPKTNEYWVYENTINAFPEFKDSHLKKLNSVEDSFIKLTLRIKYLEKWIDKLTKN